MKKPCCGDFDLASQTYNNSSNNETRKTERRVQFEPAHPASCFIYLFFVSSPRREREDKRHKVVKVSCKGRNTKPMDLFGVVSFPFVFVYIGRLSISMCLHADVCLCLIRQSGNTERHVNKVPRQNELKNTDPICTVEGKFGKSETAANKTQNLKRRNRVNI